MTVTGDSPTSHPLRACRAGCVLFWLLDQHLGQPREHSGVDRTQKMISKHPGPMAVTGCVPWPRGEGDPLHG